MNYIESSANENTTGNPGEFIKGFEQAMQNDFARRVQLLIRESGSASRLARKCGVSESVIRKWAGGASDPSRHHLIALARGTGTEILWLATGEGNACKDRAAIGELGRLMARDEASPHRAHEHTPLSLYAPLALQGEVRPDTHHSLLFERGWLGKELSADPRDLVLFQVDGKNMEPVLQRGDMVVVDRRDAGPAADGIYVLQMNDALLIRRIHRLPGGLIEASNDNPHYKSFHIKPDEAERDVTFVGRVVWSGGEM